MYEIEKNIDITGLGRKMNTKYPFSKMEVGDSFLAENRSVYNSATHWAFRERNDWQFKTRREDGKIRIWRTK